MTTPRLNILHLVVGKKGCGKTTRTLQIVEKKPRVLFVMTVDHPAFRQYKTITVSQLPVWISGKVRIVSADTEAVFKAVNACVTNAVIVYEDATKYVPYNLPYDMRVAIIDSKQRNNDIIMQFHSLKSVPREVYDNADSITLFKTRDILSSTNKVPDYVLKAEEKVRNHKSPYHFIEFELD